MIGYVMIGTNDLEKAAGFYDQVLGIMGAERFMEMERGIAYRAGENSPGVGIGKPFDGNPASVGNGMMVSLAASSPEQVKEIYDKALELGATDEGAPGARGGGPFYGAYFRDLDGNKLCAFCMAPQ